MKIQSVRIENLRSFEDETIVFDDYTCFVGSNGSGKSTVLTALNIFFREKENSVVDLTKLSEEDFHNRDTSKIIRITVTFTDLNEKAQQDFSHYYRQGKLIIFSEAKFDSDSQLAPVIQYGQRMGIPDFKPFFKAEDEKKLISELKKIYEGFKEKFSDLDSATTKPTMIEALRKYEVDHVKLCEPINSDAQFYGFSGGVNLLSRHVQWVYVPAVKDASSEEQEGGSTALSQLLKRTVRATINFTKGIEEIHSKAKQSYQILLDSNQEALNGISKSLQKRLTDWAHPGVSLRLEWQQDPDRSVKVDPPLAGIITGEGGFEGKKLARFGHGLQRSYLLALLQELAGIEDENNPLLILACEEPELYQHPPQARHLAAVFQKLSKQNSQIIISTHSPYFVIGKDFENVRLVRRETTNGCSQVKKVSMEDLSSTIEKARGDPYTIDTSGEIPKIHQILQPAVNEIFFTPVLILVEGLEDVAYIATYLSLMEKWDEFRRFGCHIVPVGGKFNLIIPYTVAQLMAIPTFIVFDSDGQVTNPSAKSKHEKNNLTLLKLSGIKEPEAFPADNFWRDNLTIWHSEISEVIDGEMATEEKEKWEAIKNQIHDKYGRVGNLNKNSLFIADTLSEAWKQNIKSSSLEKLCNSILDFASDVDQSKNKESLKI